MSVPSKEQFYQDLNVDTFCGFQWCKKLYAYQMYNDGYLEKVFAKLDELGRDRVKVIYALYVKWEIARELEEMKEPVHWLVEQTDKEYERQVRECRKLQSREESLDWMNGMF